MINIGAQLSLFNFYKKIFIFFLPKITMWTYLLKIKNLFHLSDRFLIALKGNFKKLIFFNWKII